MSNHLAVSIIAIGRKEVKITKSHPPFDRGEIEKMRDRSGIFAKSTVKDTPKKKEKFKALFLKNPDFIELSLHLTLNAWQS